MGGLNQEFSRDIELDLYDKFIDFKNESLRNVSDEQAEFVIESYIYLLLSR